MYERQERFAGTTKYPLRKMLRFAADAITSFSIRPLRFAASIGFFFGTLGIVGLVYALGSWLSGRAVPGWTSVIFTVLIIGSVQLLVLGILGEYMGRLYIESKRRPMFIIDRVIRGMPQTHAAAGPQAVESVEAQPGHGSQAGAPRLG